MTWSDLILFFFLRVFALAHRAQQCFFSCIKKSVKGASCFLFIALGLGLFAPVQSVHWTSLWQEDPREILKKNGLRMQWCV